MNKVDPDSLVDPIELGQTNERICQVQYFMNYFGENKWC